MKRRSSLFLATILVCYPSVGCISNHSFVDTEDREPDVAFLEQTRQALPATSAPLKLYQLTWVPLITLQLSKYGSSERSMLTGTTLAQSAAYGPIAMMGCEVTWLFDNDQQFYERRKRSHFGWGLWTSERNDIKVPTGWRVQAESSLLFGLLSWPTDVYTENLFLAPTSRH